MSSENRCARKPQTREINAISYYAKWRLCLSHAPRFPIVTVFLAILTERSFGCKASHLILPGLCLATRTSLGKSAPMRNRFLLLLGLLALLPVASAWAQVSYPAWGPARPAQVRDDRAYPTGLDLGIAANAPLVLSRTVTVVRAEIPPAQQPGWPSLVVDLVGEGPVISLRFLGVVAQLRPGARAEAGQSLGNAADSTQIWPGLPNHLTLEIYQDGRRIDPRQLAPRLLPRAPVLDLQPPASANTLWPQWQLRAEAASLAAADPKAAISRLRSALRYPGWKISNLDIVEDLVAASGAIADQAVRVAAVRHGMMLARAELNYAQGQLPEPLLGPVSASRNPQYLQALLNRLEAEATQLPQPAQR